MACGRAVLAAILGSALAACNTSGSPSPPPVTSWTDAPAVAISPAAKSPSPSATPQPTPKPTPKPTPVPVPPKPTGVKFDSQVRVSDDEQVAEITQTVTWRAPRSEGVEIRVYGVTKCIAEPANPAPDTHGPCLVVHTPLPASVRTLLAKAPASAGKVSWSWTQGEGCETSRFGSDPDGPPYVAVVLAAYNASGQSIFTIAEPGSWSEPLPGSMPC